MKTLCVMDSVSRANGGIFEAERRLQQSLYRETGADVQVVGLRDAYTESDRAAWSPLTPRVFETRGPQAFGFAPGLADALIEADADLAYFAGLWKYPSIAALRWAAKSGRPMMIAPHGMLDPWALRNSGLKKRLAGWLFQNAHLRKAACLRSLCPSETNSIRAYGLTNPVAVIPNGIDLPEAAHSFVPGEPAPRFSTGRKVLLYLGRIHPKKGLAPLIHAWKRVQDNRGEKWALAIAGWDQGGHEKELKRQADELGIPRGDGATPDTDACSILFLGPKFGAAKAALYARCDAFILPSVSEGLPMVVLEAWANGKPVLMTPECNLPEGFAAQAALHVLPTIASLTEGLRQLSAMSREDLQTMGANGLALVKERFAWPKIAAEMRAVHLWMLGGGPKPVSVVTSTR